MGHYREIPNDRILKFGPTPGFKGWGHFFTEESITHPAKMNLKLLKWILLNFTEKDHVVLDPMAGTGSTTILAGSMGRHGIAVEYEPKFCKMIEENIWKTQNHKTLTPKGKMACINGDARELSKHLIESDVIVSSPPYGNRLSDVAIKDGDSERMGYRQTVDIVLTSPPYGSDNANLMGRQDKHAKSILSNTGVRSIDLQSENLGNLNYGEIDAVITFPPYEASIPAHDEKWLEEHRDDKSDSPQHKTMRFGKSMTGYTKMDVIVTSPPYEESMEAKNPISTWSEEVKTKWWNNYRSQGGGMGFEDFIAYQEKQEYSYSSDTENIGNLKSDSYLEAMLQVYRECNKVLKPKGRMILVTKNFIRDKQVVRLDLDTIKLCETAGFTLLDQWYFDLPTRSFWKNIYHKKYPDVPEVKYEDVLVFEKSAVLVPPNRRNE